MNDEYLKTILTGQFLTAESIMIGALKGLTEKEEQLSMLDAFYDEIVRILGLK